MYHIFTWFLLVNFCLLATGFINSSKLAGDNTQSQPNTHLESAIVPVKLRMTSDFGSEEYARVKEYAGQYGIDFRLILAIIKQESRFDNNAISERGATGYMQLMPVTHSEVAERLSFQNDNITENNIVAGIYYFSTLLDLFTIKNEKDKVCLALAAYNAGPSRIYDAQELAAYMGEDPNSWSTIQNMLPLLSKRYYTLHDSVWPEGKPRSGYFGSWRQTVAYVDNIMRIYKDFSTIKG